MSENFSKLRENAQICYLIEIFIDEEERVGQANDILFGIGKNFHLEVNDNIKMSKTCRGGMLNY